MWEFADGVPAVDEEETKSESTVVTESKWCTFKQRVDWSLVKVLGVSIVVGLTLGYCVSKRIK